jgi:release factor glutamine methyltransferase
VSAPSAPALAAEQSRASAIAALRRSFARLRSGNTALEARCLVETACGLDRASLIASADQPLGHEPAKRLAAFAARRLAGEPLARILGMREFWGLDFGLSTATLEPRPETETLVSAALRLCAAAPGPRHCWRILDLGTGSGCVAISLLSELENARALAIDRSEHALATARENALRLGVGERVSFVAGDWTACLSGTFDIIVSNPPYVASADIGGLAAEVRDHDPHLALDGGPDGLDCHRSIVKGIAGLLSPRGRLFLEIGAGQEEAMRDLLASEGLVEIRTDRDLAGIPRVVSAIEPPLFA